MSEYRHFQDADGYVESTKNRAHEYTARPYFTEVQVAPLDAIVIDGPLPEVTTKLRDVFVAGVDTGVGHADARATAWDAAAPNAHPEWHEAKALAHLAIAAHLREHPPVDEAQVEALQALLDLEALRDKLTDAGSVAEIARRLVQRGVRVEVTE